MVAPPCTLILTPIHMYIFSFTFFLTSYNILLALLLKSCSLTFTSLYPYTFFLIRLQSLSSTCTPFNGKYLFLISLIFGLLDAQDPSLLKLGPLDVEDPSLKLVTLPSLGYVIKGPAFHMMYHKSNNQVKFQSIHQGSMMGRFISSQLLLTYIYFVSRSVSKTHKRKHNDYVIA